MSLAASVWLGLIGIVFYVYSVDPNVQDYLGLLLVQLGQKRRRLFYSLLWNPRHPWVQWRIKHLATQNSEKNARILAKELGMKE